MMIMMMIFEGKQTMVDEGEVREGKNGGSVVCYRGAWLPQVVLIFIVIVSVIVIIIVVIIVIIIVLVIVIVIIMETGRHLFDWPTPQHSTAPPTNIEDIIRENHRNHDEQVGVSDDVEVGGSVGQRASWNASLGVRRSF